MSVEVERATLPCQTCGAEVTELRRGRCWGCYSHWVDARPVGKGASCCACSERRRDFLRLVELQGRSLPFCHNCAALAMKLSPMPPTVAGLRRALARDRREQDRRASGMDRRLYPRERRVGERRADSERRGAGEPAAPDLSLADLAEVVIEIQDEDLEFIEITQVRQTRH